MRETGSRRSGGAEPPDKCPSSVDELPGNAAGKILNRELPNPTCRDARGWRRP
jgi:hypothetical protein